MNILKISLLLSNAIGVLGGLMITRAAWRQDILCSFHCQGEIHWLSLISIWFSWYLVVGLVTLGIVLFAAMAKQMLNPTPKEEMGPLP